jgi:holo-[acyl-carrier protein] synthase
MLRCGVDLVEVPRLKRAIERHGERFLQRVFTEEEIAYCRRKARPWPHWAVRFAAKEALFKSLIPGTLDVLVWREVGVSRHVSGAPSLVFHGKTRERLAGWEFALALSHERQLAVAQVIAQPPASGASSGGRSR